MLALNLAIPVSCATFVRKDTFITLTWIYGVRAHIKENSFQIVFSVK